MTKMISLIAGLMISVGITVTGCVSHDGMDDDKLRGTELINPGDHSAAYMQDHMDRARRMVKERQELQKQIDTVF